jgi:hypothetical protein
MELGYPDKQLDIRAHRLVYPSELRGLRHDLNEDVDEALNSRASFRS